MYPDKPIAPYLSLMDLERISFQVLNAYDASYLTKPRALDVEPFAERHLGLKLDFVALSNNASILGMTIFSDSSIPVFDHEKNIPQLIQVRSGTALIERTLLDLRQQGRTRFTIAHECAHWLIHKPQGKTQPIICRNVGRSEERDWLEWQADNLASALLMPAVAIHAFMKEYVSANRESMASMYRMFGQRYAIDKRNQVIRIAANTFGVSEDAAELRLIRLKYIKSMPPIVAEPPRAGTIEALAQAMFGPADPKSGFI